MKMDLSDIDASGAIGEAYENVEGDTRLDFMKKAGLGAGAVMSGGAVMAAFADSAVAAGRVPSSFGKGDIGILNYALTLEYLEAAFYDQATANNLTLDPMTATFLRTVTRDERAHVNFLKKALGRKAAKEPDFDFGATVTDVEMFKQTAQVLENTGVKAYLGQAANIKDKKILTAAGSIVTIEARHASVIGIINLLGSKGISPDGAFDRAVSAKAILKAVTGTGFIQ